MKQFVKRVLVSKFLVFGFCSYAYGLPGFSYHHPDENGAPCDDRHPMGWCQDSAFSKEYVYKILREDEWNSFQIHSCFAGSEHDLKDGFIHLTYGHQLDHVITNYFSTEGVVYIVAFKRSYFGHNLIEEQLFPHLYNEVLSKEVLLTGTLKYVMPRKQ